MHLYRIVPRLDGGIESIGRGLAVRAPGACAAFEHYGGSVAHPPLDPSPTPAIQFARRAVYPPPTATSHFAASNVQYVDFLHRLGECPSLLRRAVLVTCVFYHTTV